MWDAYEDLEVDYEEALRSFVLTTADLELVGPLHPPPQSWYDEDFTGLFGEPDPFAGEWGGE